MTTRGKSCAGYNAAMVGVIRILYEMEYVHSATQSCRQSNEPNESLALASSRLASATLAVTKNIYAISGDEGDSPGYGSDRRLT